MEKGLIVWFTGLSGAGKATISKVVAEKLKQNWKSLGESNIWPSAKNLNSHLTILKELQRW